MCCINWRPGEYDYSPRSPGPRPLPQLKWAIPLDPVKLGASLEAFYNQLPRITTLRLCHRFSTGPLSTLPQEILDHIISKAHQLEQTDVERKWEKKFCCFQGRCTRADHLEPNMLNIENAWHLMFTYGKCGCGCEGRVGGPLDPYDYTTEEKEEMVLDQINESGHYCDDRIYVAHSSKHSDWLKLVCLCKKFAAVGSDIVPFHLLQMVGREIPR